MIDELDKTEESIEEIAIENFEDSVEDIAIKELEEDVDKQLEQKRKKKILLKIILIIIIIILLLLGIRSCRNMQNNVNDGTLITSEIGNGLIPGLTAEEIEAILQKQADASMFSFDINATPTFENGKSEGNLRIVNPPYNLYDIKVKIILDDTNEVVFQSGKLKTNQYIENDKLTKRLKKGEYPATAVIEGYDVESGEYKGEVLAGLNIKILN